MEQELPARRRIVVDGSNIATEGRNLPSLAQLDEAIRTFLEEYRGFTTSDVTVVVDASFGHRIDPSEVTAFEQALEHGEMITPPAGAVGRGDGFILRIAEKSGALVLSNDSFQEFHAERPWLFEAGRLIGGKPVPGVGWIFTPRTPVRGAKSRSVTGKSRRDARAADNDAAAAPDQNGSAESVDSEPQAGRSRRSGRAAKAAPAVKVAKATKAAKAGRTAKATLEAADNGTVEEETATGPAKAKKATKASKAAKSDKATKAVKTAKATKATKATKAGKATKASKAALAASAETDGGNGSEEVGRRTGATKAAKATKATKVAKKAGATKSAPERSDPQPESPSTAPVALNDPMTFLTFVADHPVGSELEGIVVSFTSHGAHIDVGGMLCHVPLRGLADPPPNKARQVLTKGETRTFVLVSLDAARRRAELALPGVAL
jgi:Zc3h12a-like Ribonuclease NYN domain/S1 RNA binding domain